MQKKRIVLHGKVSAVIEITDFGKISTRGLPPESIIYAVTYKSMPVPIENASFDDIAGIIVTDRRGNVTAEGRTDRFPGSNSGAKLFLVGKRQDVKERNTEKEHSDALKEILERADRMFAPIEEKEKTEKAEQRRGFNPFSEMYPDSEWKKVMHRHDRAYHLKGTVHIAGKTLDVTAVPVSFYSEQAFLRDGFTKVARSDDGMLYRMRVTRDTN